MQVTASNYKLASHAISRDFHTSWLYDDIKTSKQFFLNIARDTMIYSAQLIWYNSLLDVLD